MALGRYLPENPKFGFMRFRRVSFPVSALLALTAFLLFSVQGLNFGIDFRGGTLIEAQAKSGQADIAALRTGLNALDVGDVQIQEFGGPTDVLIRIGTADEGTGSQEVVIGKIREAIGEAYEFRRVETVGPSVSNELIRNSTLAVILSSLVILFYLWFRFEWQFALGAVITTLHDVLLMIGVYVALGIDFDLTSIAAVLTIMGYSLNDTVVVYDRIRELLRRYKKLPISDILDEAINSTLSRTIITSATTFIAVGALFLFGGKAIHGFSLAMLVGIFVGTYSTILIGAPILIYFGLRAGAKESSAS